MDRGQQQLELAAPAWAAADENLSAVRSRHRAHQRQPQPGSPGMAAVAAAEPVENMPKLLVGDALPSVEDDHPHREAGPGRLDRQLYDIAIAGVPYGVLEQRVDRQPEPFPVRLCGGLVQPAELPAAIGGRPPPAQDLHGEAVERDRLRIKELGILGGRDDEQPLGDPPQPVQLAKHHLNVVSLLPAGQAGGEQLGVPERDGDRGAKLVRGVLQEPALGGEQPRVFLADQARLLFRGELAPGVPDHGQEHGRHQRDLGELGARFGAARHVQANASGGRRHDHAKHREGGLGRPGTEPVHQRDAYPDQVEGDRLPARKGKDGDQVDRGEDRPPRVEQCRAEWPAEPDGEPAEPAEPGEEAGAAPVSCLRAGSPHLAPS